MADAEIERVRALLASTPRSTVLAERRKRLDTFGEQSPLPADVRVSRVDAGGVPGEWTSTRGADPNRVLLYLHGGGYISGSIVSHRAMVAEAGRAAGVRTLAIDYRLAPEHPYPAALQDALAAYDFLLSTDIDARDVVVAGDSAGGGLALALLLSLRDARVALPGCAWCLSPWVDLAMTGASLASKAAIDPLIQKAYLIELANAYLAGGDPRDPLVSPLYADVRGLPPVLVQVGSAETLLDDAVRLAGALGEADVAVTLEIYPDMIHAWPLFFGSVAAGRRALAAAGRFVRERGR